jgi:hypothetical protein
LALSVLVQWESRLLQKVIHNSAGQSYMADHWFERIERVSRSPDAPRHQWEGFYKTLSVALGAPMNWMFLSQAPL